MEVMSAYGRNYDRKIPNVLGLLEEEGKKGVGRSHIK